MNTRVIDFKDFNTDPGKFFHNFLMSSQLFLIHTDEEGVDNLVLTVRGKGLKMGNEVVPPGGKLNYCDKSKVTELPIIAAIREGKEETNLTGTKVKKIGSFFVPLGFHVDCYIGKVDSLEDVKRCENEVQAIFLIPIETLKQLEPRSLETPVKYNPDLHTKELESGFTGKTDVLYIKPDQVKILDGNIDPETELAFRSYYPFKMLMNFIQSSPEPLGHSFELAEACRNIGKFNPRPF